MPASKKQEQLESKRKDSKSEGTKTKKSKKIKSKKLSDDAKSRQQEQRAAVEEERRRLREELINSFLKVFNGKLIDYTITKFFARLLLLQNNWTDSNPNPSHLLHYPYANDMQYSSIAFTANDCM